MESTVNYNRLMILPSISDVCCQLTLFIKKLSEGKEYISIALSGGSTPKALFDYWTENVTLIPWEKIHFFWGDERCVPPEDEMSNYGMTKKHLFDKVSVPSQHIFRIHGEEDPGKEAKRYGKIIPEHFDLIILGLGDDGHTASIFPGQISLWDSPDNCIIASHPDTSMKRVSISGKVINNAENVVFLATGKNKAEKVYDIIRNRQQYMNQYPAAKVQPASGNLYWFLDEEAGSKLNEK